ncbi:MAG: DnaJ domain-containing protein [Clostridiales bacterium]|jgi:curved DNA-binding protein CbpA|nr:DnaJ domain-containing protein [Clostridiales bacterium]
MNDPYSVLGISHNASDEEIKKAYRELVRKYHPDNYHNNPLADLAQEKMKEINEAYDAITKERSGGSYTGGGSYNAGSTYTRSAGGSPEFTRIRTAINAGDLDLAEQLLRSSDNRNAEWHFLMGSLYYRKGWLDEARRYFETAAGMEPGNQEYVQALNYMYRGGQAYSPYGYAYNQHMGGCSACDICTAFICADACCNCF